MIRCRSIWSIICFNVNRLTTNGLFDGFHAHVRVSNFHQAIDPPLQVEVGSDVTWEKFKAFAAKKAPASEKQASSGSLFGSSLGARTAAGAALSVVKAQ